MGDEVKVRPESIPMSTGATALSLSLSLSLSLRLMHTPSAAAGNLSLLPSMVDLLIDIYSERFAHKN